MLYISVEDFLSKSSGIKRLSRQEEKVLAQAMKNGSTDAREALIRSYLPQVAANVRRCGPYSQSLSLVYECLQALEKAVDSFDFSQDSETFAHRLSWWLRQTTVRHIANR